MRRCLAGLPGVLRSAVNAMWEPVGWVVRGADAGLAGAPTIICTPFDVSVVVTQCVPYCRRLPCTTSISIYAYSTRTYE